MKMKMLALSGLILCTPLAARAQESEIAFRSPSNNIHCLISNYGGDAYATCEILESTPSYRKKPKDCELDWGSSFSVGRTGGGEMNCHGDTIQNPTAPVLGYGQSAARFGIACVSSQTGMRCTNREGRGFEIARARQKLF